MIVKFEPVCAQIERVRISGVYFRSESAGIYLDGDIEGICDLFTKIATDGIFKSMWKPPAERLS